MCKNTEISKVAIYELKISQEQRLDQLELQAYEIGKQLRHAEANLKWKKQ